MHVESIEAIKPWDSPDAYQYHEDVSKKSQYEKDSIFYGRITDEYKVRAMKIVYRMLKENYSITNREIMAAIREDGKDRFKQLKEVITTLSDFLPIWLEQDDENRSMYWYGMLNRERQHIEELED